MTQIFVLLWCLTLLLWGAQPHDARALLLRGRGWSKTQATYYGRRVVVRVQIARVR